MEFANTNIKRLKLNKDEKIENFKEIEANNEVSILMNNLTTLINRKDPLIKSIKSPKLLMRELAKLRDLVEMCEIKQTVVKQIKFLLINQARSSEARSLEARNSESKQRFDGHMLHSVISGNPGTGKTTVAMILAKIWMALGLVKQPQTTPLTTDLLVSILNDTYRKRIHDLEEMHIRDTKRLDKIKELSTKAHKSVNELRRNTVKLKTDKTDLDNKITNFLSIIRDLRFNFDDLIKECNLTKGTGGVIEDIYENSEPKFIIATRADLVAEFVGQTAIKTTKILESALGGVLFIDEAYSICYMDDGSNDKFGEECLTVINEYMGLHSEELIVIFGGYKEKLLNTIFKVQPGLIRRCTWFFEIEDYSIKGLVKIFNCQLTKTSWKLDENVKLEEILKQYDDLIKGGGGFTNKLLFYAKLEFSEMKFNEVLRNDETNITSVLSKEMIIEALKRIRKNVLHYGDDSFPTHMYL